jgi:hypothetical protein
MASKSAKPEFIRVPIEHSKAVLYLASRGKNGETNLSYYASLIPYDKRLQFIETVESRMLFHEFCGESNAAKGVVKVGEEMHFLPAFVRAVFYDFCQSTEL